MKPLDNATSVGTEEPALVNHEDGDGKVARVGDIEFSPSITWPKPTLTTQQRVTTHV